ncbi:MAG: hypothetical protein QXK35_06465 [Nitrososphaerales archaeon]
MKVNKTLTNQVKKLLKKEGADLFGIASIDRFEKAPEGHRPKDILSSAQSVIVFAKRMLYSPIEGLPHTRLEYTNQFFVVNAILNTIAYKICNFLESKGFKAIPIPPAYPRFEDKLFGVFSHRHAAVEAGLGEIALSNLLVTPQYGPRVRLTSIITDAPLEPNSRFENELCKNYRKICNLACVRMCPVNAISDSGVLNKFLCLHNQEKILNSSDPRGVVGPRDFELRCGVCIAVCPIGRRG